MFYRTLIYFSTNEVYFFPQMNTFNVIPLLFQFINHLEKFHNKRYLAALSIVSIWDFVFVTQGSYFIGGQELKREKFVGRTVSILPYSCLLLSKNKFIHFSERPTKVWFFVYQKSILVPKSHHRTSFVQKTQALKPQHSHLYSEMLSSHSHVDIRSNLYIDCSPEDMNMSIFQHM